MLEALHENTTDAAALAQQISNKILESLSQPYQIAPHVCHSTASIGVALFTDHSESVDDLLKRADLSMYQAKASGRNAIRFFDPQVQATLQAKAAMELALREGLERGQFCLHFQPQVTMAGKLAGAEALVRWQHPKGALIPPGSFIPLAEQTGLIVPLGAWVLEQACRQLALWGGTAMLEQLTLAVNVSAVQFRRTDFVDLVVSALAESDANPNRLKLELTESLLVDNIEDVVRKMTALKAMGVSFSLDDFGTGYSSLAYLSRLPLDQLKIDQCFVRDIEVSDNAVAICVATIGLAHSLRLNVVAEGVETAAQKYFLGVVHHCDFMQGYLFSKPLPLVDFEALAVSEFR